MEQQVAWLAALLAAFPRPPRKDEVRGAPVLKWNRGLYCLRGHFWDSAPKLLRALKGSEAALKVLVHGNQGKGGLPRLKREAGLVPASLRPHHRALIRALERAGKAKSDKARLQALAEAVKALEGAFTEALGAPLTAPTATTDTATESESEIR